MSIVSLGGVARLLPPARWLRSYNRDTFKSDLAAGLTVAVMLIPQGMAYAALAGMPPVTGLYASIVPLLAYALLGTSGQLAVGPVAIVALLTASTLTPLAGGDPATYAALAAVLAVMVGSIQLLVGALRLGGLVNLLSHSVISGFTSAAAIVIAFSQVKDLLGVQTERSEDFIGAVVAVSASLGETNPPTVAIAVLSIAALVIGRRFLPRLPTALLVMVAATAATALAGLADHGVAILQEVPAGLPAPALPVLSLETVRALTLPALTIALISYLEGVSVAKAIAARTREPVNPTQELVATGTANLAAGLFRAFPVAGGFSRTAVNYQAGARTPMASVITAVVIAFTVALFTPLLSFLPRAVLAAVIVVAVTGLVDIEGARRTWRIRRLDGAALGVTFLGTLFIGIEPGIAIGVAFSLAGFIWRSATPHMAELGQVEGTRLYRNIERYRTLTDPRFALLRVDGPLYFANAKFVEDRLTALAASRPGLKAVILDCSAVSDIDTSGEHSLREADRELSEAGVGLHLATVRGPVRDVLRRSSLWEHLGESRTHPDLETAVARVCGDCSSPLRPDEPAEPPTRVH